LQLLFNAHFVQRENWNAHSSNYITRACKIDISKEAMNAGMGRAREPNAIDCTMYRYAIDAQIGAEAAPALE
jgi:hypothetical protein